MPRKYPKNFLVDDADVRRIQELSNVWGTSNSAALRKSVALCHHKFVEVPDQKNSDK